MISIPQWTGKTRNCYVIALLAGTPLLSCSRTGLDVDLEPIAETPYCAPRFADCDQIAVNGCETDLQSSNNHCGACGVVCPPEQVCALGECRDGTDIVQIEAAAFSNCVRRAMGTVECWGMNDFGQLGRGTVGEPGPLGKVLELDDAVQLSAAGRHVCARKSPGTIACWGLNRYGQLGDGTTTDRSLPTDVSTIKDATSVIANATTCSIRADGTLWCWGENNNQKISTDFGDQLIPSPILNFDRILNAAAGNSICVIDVDNQLWSWGINNWGSVGDGTTIDRNKPKVILKGIVSVTNSVYACAIDTIGQVWCWGYWNPDIPVLRDGVTNAIKVVIGLDHACALLASREVVCWGQNIGGLLGAGDFGDHSENVLVKGLTDVIDLSAGSYHTCALERTGHVRCWGKNDFGQLGDETTERSPFPVEVHNLP